MGPGDPGGGSRSTWDPAAQLTHAVLHHHEAALVALEALALKAARCVDTDPAPAEVRRDPALINVYTVWFQRNKKTQRVKKAFRLETRIWLPSREGAHTANAGPVSDPGQ